MAELQQFLDYLNVCENALNFYATPIGDPYNAKQICEIYRNHVRSDIRGMTTANQINRQMFEVAEATIGYYFADDSDEMLQPLLEAKTMLLKLKLLHMNKVHARVSGFRNNQIIQID